MSSDGNEHKNYKEHHKDEAEAKVIKNCFATNFWKAHWYYTNTDDLLTVSRSSLEKLEPEREDRNWIKNISNVIFTLMIIAGSMFIIYNNA
jgi:hypothetical protein